MNPEAGESCLNSGNVLVLSMCVCHEKRKRGEGKKGKSRNPRGKRFDCASSCRKGKKGLFSASSSKRSLAASRVNCGFFVIYPTSLLRARKKQLNRIFRICGGEVGVGEVDVFTRDCWEQEKNDCALK